MDEAKYEELIAAFHKTWELFPGQARLIDRTNRVIAVNAFAAKNGRTPGEICAKFGKPESHMGCRKKEALDTGEGKLDRPFAERVRGWVPLEGYPDIVVHFSLAVPEVNSYTNRS